MNHWIFKLSKQSLYSDEVGKSYIYYNTHSTKVRAGDQFLYLDKTKKYDLGQHTHLHSESWEYFPSLWIAIQAFGTIESNNHWALGTVYTLASWSFWIDDRHRPEQMFPFLLELGFRKGVESLLRCWWGYRSKPISLATFSLKNTSSGLETGVGESFEKNTPGRLQ